MCPLCPGWLQNISTYIHFQNLVMNCFSWATAMFLLFLEMSSWWMSISSNFTHFEHVCSIVSFVLFTAVFVFGLSSIFSLCERHMSSFHFVKCVYMIVTVDFHTCCWNAEFTRYMYINGLSKSFAEFVEIHET